MGNDNSISATTAKYQIGQWRYLTYVFSNTTHTARIYADGILVAEEPFNQSFGSANSQDLYLGKYSVYWYALNGKLDEMRIYNRALSPAEVMILYQLSYPIEGTAPWNTTRTVTCENVTKSTPSVTFITTKITPAWNCERAGLIVQSGDKVKVTIEGTKY